MLGPYAIQNVIDDLNTDNLFYCLQTDASNKKNIKLFPLVVQYFTAKNGIQNKLIDFYENSNESADGMFQAIQKSMEKYKLPFHNVSGLSADNTNANFGVNHSLFTNMRDLVPDLIKGNCHAHIVHNCMRHEMCIRDRNYSSRLVNTVYRNRSQLCDVFSAMLDHPEQIESEILAPVSGFLSVLEEFKFVFFLITFDKIFSYTDVLFNIPQSQANDILYCLKTVSYTHLDVYKRQFLYCP